MKQIEIFGESFSLPSFVILSTIGFVGGIYLDLDFVFEKLRQVPVSVVFILIALAVVAAAKYVSQRSLEP
jgi:hypothetical protein